VFVVVCYGRPILVNGVVYESTENANDVEIPDYDNLSDDDDDEIRFAEGFGTYKTNTVVSL